MRLRLPDDLILKSVGLRDQYFDLKGLAAYSALSVSSLRTHIKTNGLSCYQLGGKLLVRKSQFDTWVERFRMAKSENLDRVVEKIMGEIGEGSRRSRRVTK